MKKILSLLLGGAILGIGFFIPTSAKACTILFPIGGGSGWGCPGGIQANTFILGNGLNPYATTTIPLTVPFGGTGNTSFASSTLAISNGTNLYGIATSSLGLGTGTVTSVATNNGLTGGVITTTGTLGLDLTNISNNALLTYNGTRLAATGTPALTVGYIIATSTTATSTFANGIDMSAGCFAVSGTCLQTFIQNATAYKSAANYATAAVLPGTPTYNNGTGGVGATLTEIGLGVLTVDGQTVSVGQRILVKNEATQANNGVYVVTNAGSAIANYILTRATDFNTTNDVYAGVTVPVLAGGTANGDTSWVQTTTGTITIGTTAIVFIESSLGTNSVTSVSGTWPIISSGGFTPFISFGGLSTSSPAVVGNIPYFTGVNTFGNVATTSVSCSGSVSCTSFTAIGASPITITGSGGSSFGQAWEIGANGHTGFLAPTTTIPVFVGQASSTQFSVSGTTTLATDGVSRVGVGTSSPFASSVFNIYGGDMYFGSPTRSASIGIEPITAGTSLTAGNLTIQAGNNTGGTNTIAGDLNLKAGIANDSNGGTANLNLYSGGNNFNSTLFGAIRFLSGPSTLNTNGAEVGRFSSNGNFGVGTISPNTTIEASSTSAGSLKNELILRNQSNTVNTSTGLAFINGTAATQVSSQINSIVASASNNDLVFSTRSSLGLNEGFRLFSSGQILVGTTTPMISAALGGGNPVVTAQTVGGGITTCAQSYYSGGSPLDCESFHKVATSNATATVIDSFLPPTSGTYAVNCDVTAHRTGGSAGTAEDGAYYGLAAAFKNNAGTVTQIGATTATFTAIESVAAYNATITVSGGNSVNVNAVGVASTNITWTSACHIFEAGQ